MLHLSKMFKSYAPLVALIATVLTRSNDMAPTQRTFSLQLSPQRGPVRLGAPWFEDSVASCANSCMSRYANECLAFLFNLLSGLCTPGSVIGGADLKPTLSEGSFFHSYCNANAGFRVVTIGTTSACVAVFKKGNYSEVTDLCHSKRAFLMSVKTIDKMGILVQVAGGNTVWVGCDALVGGEYVWQEDGSVLTNETISDNFLPGDPNYRQGEYCVTLTGSRGKLIDYNCSYVGFYACEMSMP